MHRRAVIWACNATMRFDTFVNWNHIRSLLMPIEVEDVLKLRGSVEIEYSLATRGANKLWQLLHTEPFVAALGAQTGNQAVQMVRAGLKAIYLSGTPSVKLLS